MISLKVISFIRKMSNAKKKKKKKRQTAYSAATTPKSTRSSHTDITSELTLTGSCTLIDVGRVDAFSTLREIECESIMSSKFVWEEKECG